MCVYECASPILEILARVRICPFVILEVKSLMLSVNVTKATTCLTMNTTASGTSPARRARGRMDTVRNALSIYHGGI